MENINYSKNFSEEFIKAIGEGKLNYELNYANRLAREVFGERADISEPEELIFAEEDDEEPFYCAIIRIRVHRRSCFRLMKYRDIFLDRLSREIPGSNLAVFISR